MPINKITPVTHVYWSRLRAELAPEGVFPNLVAGLVALTLVVVESLSYAALIFAGPLTAFVGLGVTMTLTTAVVVGFATAVFASYPGVVAFSQNKIAAILAYVAAALGTTATAAIADQQEVFSVAAAIFFSAIMTGIFLTLLGAFRLGRLIRFIPYPVVRGFLASVGWLLCLGSLKTMTGMTVGLTTAERLLRPDLLVHWLPGLVFALTAYFLIRRLKHYLAMPGLMVGAILLF